MPAVFDRLGIRFVYPENWKLDDQDAIAGSRAVTVTSPGGAFWTVSIHAPGAEVMELVNTAVDAMRQVYRDMDVEYVQEELAGHRLVGCEMNFICLDMTNTAQVRCASTTQGTFLLFCQADDREFDAVQQVFAAITASMLEGIAPMPAFVNSSDFIVRSFPEADFDVRPRSPR